MKYITASLFLFVAPVWGWQGFKKIEPDVLPVVENFNIDAVSRTGDSLIISGSMDKVRECNFKGITVYDIAHITPRLLDVQFLETPSGRQNRALGVQLWGAWKITPSTKNILLIATHRCDTGIVKTRLYHGAI